MNKVATLNSSDRAELFRETATRMRLPAALVEKDFWVCWTLKQLFSLESLRGKILFKGGTSLSKIFGTIQRFSEDIDLAINYEMLGFTGPRHPSSAPSRNKRQKLLDDMLVACCNYVQGDFLNLLRQSFGEVLGRTGPWHVQTRPSDKHSVVVEFFYPPCLRQNEAVVLCLDAPADQPRRGGRA